MNVGTNVGVRKKNVDIGVRASLLFLLACYDFVAFLKILR